MTTRLSPIDAFVHSDCLCTAKGIQKVRWGIEEFCKHYPGHETGPHLVKSHCPGQISAKSWRYWWIHSTFIKSLKPSRFQQPKEVKEDEFIPHYHEFTCIQCEFIISQWIHKACKNSLQGCWELTWLRDNSSLIAVSSLAFHVNSLGSRTNSHH
jgi:hypothetical protein